MRFAIALLLAAAPLGALQAQTMTAGQFLAKAQALQAKGVAAMFSKDIGLLKKEGQAAGKAVRARQAADLKAGRKAVFCMPEKAEMNSDELIAHLKALPPAQRNMSFQAAFAGLVQKKYPCPA